MEFMMIEDSTYNIVHNLFWTQFKHTSFCVKHFLVGNSKNTKKRCKWS